MEKNKMIWENSVTLVLITYGAIIAVSIFLVTKFTKDRKISNLRLIVQIAAVIAVFSGLLVLFFP